MMTRLTRERVRYSKPGTLHIDGGVTLGAGAL